MGLFDIERFGSKKLRKEWSIPEKIEFEYSFEKENKKIEYLVEIRPIMKDLKGEGGERIYTKIILNEIIKRTFEYNKFWKPKKILKKIFSDCFPITKNDSFKNFKYSFSQVSGLEESVVEDMLGEHIKNLLTYRKNRFDPSIIKNCCK